MERSRETYWEAVAFSQARDSDGLDQGVAVKMGRSSQSQGALWRERQQIDFKREELNTNCKEAIQKVTTGSYNWEEQGGADLRESWNQKPEDPQLFSL